MYIYRECLSEGAAKKKTKVLQTAWQPGQKPEVIMLTPSTQSALKFLQSSQNRKLQDKPSQQGSL